MRDCFLKADPTEAVAVEGGENPQALWVRVGPVFDGENQRREPGVWISWQDEYMNSSLGGPVLLTPRVWRQLAQAVESAISRWESRAR